ncbi:MAG: class I SAM-dependent methyltransferase [Candidatus Zixiibacteriota bacterium]
MSYAEITYRSRNPIRRRLHDKRFKDARDLLAPKENDKILDYGCGDGHLLELCKTKVKADNLIGYDPVPVMAKDAHNNLKGTSISVYSDLHEIRTKFDKVACLDTIEHLYEDDIHKLMNNLYQLSKKDALILISVPIEIGIPVIFKNLFRLLRKRADDTLNFRDYINTILKKPVPRIQNQIFDGNRYIYSHVGFDHRDFEKVLKKYFNVEQRICMPFPVFGTSLNNSIYYICKK